MLYLLGGAARTGKTTIAQAFLSKTGIPFFSLDFLMMGFANGLPEYGLDPEADELLVAEQLWPVVRAMLTAMVEEEIDYWSKGCSCIRAMPGNCARNSPDVCGFVLWALQKWIRRANWPRSGALAVGRMIGYAIILMNGSFKRLNGSRN